MWYWPHLKNASLQIRRRKPQGEAIPPMRNFNSYRRTLVSVLTTPSRR
jgi:hypothetical protein